MARWITIVITAGIMLSLIACSSPAPSPTAVPAKAAPPAAAAPTAAPVAPAAPAPTTAPVAAAAPTKPAAPAALEKINFGIVTPSPSYWAVFAAQSQGFLKANGIEIDILYTNSSADLTKGLISGSINMGMSATDAAIVAIENGATIKITGGVINKSTYDLIGQKGMTKLADMKGKILGMTSLTTGDTLLAKKLINSSGLKDSDYSVIVSGAMAQRLAAMTNGAIHATSISDPQESMLLDQGFQLLGKTSDVVKDYQFLVHLVETKWAATHSDTVVRFLKGVKAGTAWLYDPKNKEAAVKILVDVVKIEPQYAEKTYNRYQEFAAWPKDVSINVAGVKTVQGVLVEGGAMKETPDPAKYFDLSYLQKVNAQ